MQASTSTTVAMTCRKFHTQSCSLVWFLSTVYLVGIAQPKLADVKHATPAAFNLVIQRSRIAGGTLTIPLDSTVKLVKGPSKDTEHHITRLQHGSNSKHLVMRASSSQEREQWLVAIKAAMSISLHSGEHVHVPGSASCTGNARKVSMSTQAHRMPKRAQNSQPSPNAASTRGGCSLRRMVRQNIPAAMQFFITVGQIIASAY